MNAGQCRYKHEDLTGRIIKQFYDVYNELGHGFLESVHEKALAIALQQAGLTADRRVPIPVYFRNELVGEFEADLLVEKSVILELKAARTLDSSHEAQLLNYLRATPMEVGLLLNFGPKPEIKRMAFDNASKGPQMNAD
jgi:GxxExxY protein